MMLSGRVDAMNEAEGVLRQPAFANEFTVASTVYKSRDFAMIDVIHPACSKGSSLAEWATLRGFAREEVMAIGDNHNDMEMLSFAGIAVVMGNCVQELRKYGWHQTSSNDDNGVAAAIEQVALREVT